MTDERMFADVAVREGFVSRERIEDCLRMKDPRPLPNLLRDHGLLTPTQIQAIHDIARVHAADAASAADPDEVPDQISLNAHSVSAALHEELLHVVAEGGTVGPYRILAEIGRGATGVVFKAVHKELGNIVALKLLRASTGLDPVLLKRFRLDAQAAGRISHPNIVGVHDTGEADGAHYIAMDYIDGTTLQRAMLGRRSRLRELVRAVELTARALHHAHLQGIVHRDLKPANIMLDAAGEPHVTDFGLAQAIDAKHIPDRTGPSPGTPYYMSPEQVRGDDANDARSDVYALGVILYELLAGRVPHPAPTLAEVRRLILAGRPEPPSAHDPSASPALEAVCLRAIDRDKECRHPSAGEFADDLARALASTPDMIK